MSGAVVVGLTDLAREINRYHAEAEGAVGAALGYAREAGDRLAQAKEQVPHGEWGAWLAAKFEGSERTAQSYMKVAERWEELAQIRSGVADLSLRGALKLLADPKPAARSESPPARTALAPHPTDPPPSTNGHAPPPKPEIGTGQPPEEWIGGRPDSAEDVEPAMDPLAEWERAEREVTRLEQLVETFEGDTEKELAALSLRYAQLEGRVRELQTEANEAKSQAKRNGEILKKIAKKLEVERWSEILPALEDLLR